MCDYHMLYHFICDMCIQLWKVHKIKGVQQTKVRKNLVVDFTTTSSVITQKSAVLSFLFVSCPPLPTMRSSVAAVWQRQWTTSTYLRPCTRSTHCTLTVRHVFQAALQNSLALKMLYCEVKWQHLHMFCVVKF